MPTVIVIRGFTIKVNIIEDGDGPHVHVLKDGREYRVMLLEDDARLLTAGGRERVTKAEARLAVQIVLENLTTCWRAWNKWHP